MRNFIAWFRTYIHSITFIPSHSCNTFIRLHWPRFLSISSLLVSLVGKTSLGCRAGNRTRACLTVKLFRKNQLSCRLLSSHTVELGLRRRTGDTSTTSDSDSDEACAIPWSYRAPPLMPAKPEKPGRSFNIICHHSVGTDTKLLNQAACLSRCLTLVARFFFYFDNET